jgi:hypothetical protein
MANFKLNFLFKLGHADSLRYTSPGMLSISPLTVEAKAGVPHRRGIFEQEVTKLTETFPIISVLSDCSC